MYHCGPTVYDYPHIGNLRAYVFADVLRRLFEVEGYTVKQVINITDIGHLSSDADDGEDKMVRALQREGLPLSLENMLAVGTKYFNAFRDDLHLLNIKTPQHFPRASEHIPEQIMLVEELMHKQIAYQTSDGIYFDTARFGHQRYAAFARLDLMGMKVGTRIEANPEKRSPFDFALWKFNEQLGWESPWGRGFPGWHLECSAMSRTYLGQPLDIHTGGIDHIPIHHTNEIAQSEAAYGVPLARYWMHVAHMTVNEEKMSKSIGNTYTLANLAAHGISPMAFRYWLLTANYRTTINFTWEAVRSSLVGRLALENALYSGNEPFWDVQRSPDNKYMSMFLAVMRNDLNSAQGISVLWELATDRNIDPATKIKTAEKMDEILGLRLNEAKERLKVTPSDAVRALLLSRQKARDQKNWGESDRLRDEIRKLGYIVKDTPEGQVLERAQNAG